MQAGPPFPTGPVSGVAQPTGQQTTYVGYDGGVSGVRGAPEITGRFSRDGSSGFPVEPGRYQLYASLADPWSQRALVVRRLLGLERVIGLSLTEPVVGDHGWRFPDQTGGRDPLTGAYYLSELYLATDPAYAGRATVPLLWDTRTHRIVTNDFAQITVQMETAFSPFHRPGAPDLYPAAQRRDIEALATLIHRGGFDHFIIRDTRIRLQNRC
jgi:putative glutathione S-transferase